MNFISDKKIKMNSSLLKTRLFQLFVLAALVIYAYYPFLTSTNLGARDAQYYQYMLNDSLAQFNLGFFPTYVGQSVFSPLGTPFISGVMYLFLGQLINLAAFNLLSPLLIQHLTIIWSALFASILVYFLIDNLFPKFGWQAVLLAFLYVSSPAIISFPYLTDSYHAFMVIPFIPLVIFGIIKCIAERKLSNYVIIAIGLSLSFMCHPPIAIWTLTFTAIILIILLIIRKTTLSLLIFTALLFFFLSAWQLIGNAQLNTEVSGTSIFSLSGSLANPAITQLLRYIPDTFLPLSLGKTELSFLQIGYSFWFIFIVGVLISLRKSFFSTPIRVLIFWGILLVLLLYPIYPISYFLWGSIPTFLLNLTTVWPNLRLYIIFAGVVTFLGGFVFDYFKKNLFLMLLIPILLGWNLYELRFFINHGIKLNESSLGLHPDPKSWASSANIYYFPHRLPGDFTPGQTYAWGVHSPYLLPRVVDQFQTPIESLNNNGSLLNKCQTFGQSIELNNINLTNSQILVPSSAAPIANFSLPKKDHYYFCLDAAFSSDSLIIQILDKNRREIFTKEIKKYYPISQSQALGSIGLDLNLNSFPENIQPLGMIISARDKSTLKVNSLKFIDFQLDSLPVKVESFTPLVLNLMATEGNNFLEIPKLFLPGYLAYVNDRQVSIIQSKDKTILIPLLPNVENKIRLVYAGTFEMKVSFYISLVAWIFSFLFLIFNRKFYKLLKF